MTTCGQCGYEVKDSESLRCPRCGASLIQKMSCAQCKGCSLFGRCPSADKKEK